MRVLFPMLLLLGGCQQDFDDKFAETEKKIKAAEKKLDADMADAAAKEPGEASNNK